MAMTTKEMRDRISARMPGAEGEEIIKCLDSLNQDSIAFKSAFNALVAKLNADAGVTDTNYAPIP